MKACPFCGGPIRPESKKCQKCGWRAEPPDAKATGMIAVLVICVFALLITASCSYRSYTSPRGDVLGFGQVGLVQSGVLLLTIVWLAAGLSLRSRADRKRKHEVFRASSGMLLGFLACLLSIGHVMAAPDRDAAWTLLLLISGVALFATSMKTLARG